MGRGKFVTTSELKMILSGEFSDKELSKKLGRSVSAIQTIRYRYKKQNNSKEQK